MNPNIQSGNKEEKNKDKVFFISTYNPNDDLLAGIVKRYCMFLGISPTTIHGRKLVCGYRQPKNHRDHLVKANIPLVEGDEVEWK